MVTIFIEAKNDKQPEYEFLRAILDNMGIEKDKYEIVPTDGYTNLLNPNAANIGKMKANADAGGKNLVLFDADTLQNGGGFEARKDYLLKGADKEGVSFDLFLWPNNSEDGDVEILIESTARKDLYPEFFDCFKKYEICISSRKNNDGKQLYSTPNRKGKLNTYFNALPISKSRKDKAGRGAWWFDNPSIWNLNAETLSPLKEFLGKFF